MKFHKAAKIADLAEDPLMKVQVQDIDIVIARANDNYFAFAHRCTHRGGPLAKGELAGHTITCPWHGGVFDICSGELLHPPPVEHVRSYPVRISGEDIEIGIEEAEAE